VSLKSRLAGIVRDRLGRFASSGSSGGGSAKGGKPGVLQRIGNALTGKTTVPTSRGGKVTMKTTSRQEADRSRNAEKDTRAVQHWSKKINKGEKLVKDEEMDFVTAVNRKYRLTNTGFTDKVPDRVAAAYQRVVTHGNNSPRAASIRSSVA
jgi:hypothetical protein